MFLAMLLFSCHVLFSRSFVSFSTTFPMKQFPPTIPCTIFLLIRENEETKRKMTRIFDGDRQQMVNQVDIIYIVSSAKLILGIRCETNANALTPRWRYDKTMYTSRWLI